MRGIGAESMSDLVDCYKLLQKELLQLTCSNANFLAKIPDVTFTHGEVKEFPRISIKVESKVPNNNNNNKKHKPKRKYRESDDIEKDKSNDNKHPEPVSANNMDPFSVSSVNLMNPSFESLKNLSSWGPCGKCDQTVTDLSVRKVLELKNTQLEVHWGQLEEVLREISDKLMPGKKLKATFYKLLIYIKGNFFRTHLDSKRSSNHLLTLAVNCGYTSSEPLQGGEVTIYSTRNKQKNTIWNSNQEWACWHTQLYHKVNKVESGVRVIAMYDVLVEEEDGPAAAKKFKFSEPIYQFSLPDEIWMKIESFCGLPYVLSQVSKQLSVLFNSEFIIKSQILNSIESIQPYLLILGMKYFGILLSHNYSYDSEIDTELSPLSLIGSDRILFNALKLLNFPLKITKCKIVVEKFSEPESADSKYAGFRIAKDIITVDKRWERFTRWENRQKKVLKVPKQFRRIFNSNTISSSLLDGLSATLVDYDSEPSKFPIPFLGVAWCTTFEQLSKRKMTCEETLGTEMWGNQAMFSQYWYHTSVLLIELNQIERFMWSCDFKCWDDE